MKPALELKVGQRLSMTPQLQHSIKMLQCSALELRTEIQQALDSNPLLEEDYPDDLSAEASGVDADYELAGADPKADAAQTDTEPASTDQRLAEEHIPRESVLDVDLDAEFDPPIAPAATTRQLDKTPDFEFGKASPVSLQQHLMAQVSETSFSTIDRLIAEAIISYISEDGYLRTPFDEIQQVVSKSTPDSEIIELDEIMAVLRRVQNFDPDGIGARDLSECLSLQLQSHRRGLMPCADDSKTPPSTPDDQAVYDTALRLVDHHLDQLATQDFKSIKRSLDVTDEQISEAVTLIQSLNPRPGYQIADNAAPYVVPDVIARRWNGQWRVQLNGAALPKLRVTNTYDSMLTEKKGSSSKDERDYVREHLNDARWFIKTIHNRNDTLLRVASEIVARQQAYFEQGEKAMKPMVLKDIATALELHESTISRATNQKYLLTPSGVVELKYFFSASLSADGDASDAHSSTAVRSLIRDLIAAESSKKPISDSKIASLLKEKDVQIARRTVAKYRESMNIASSSQRKSL